MNQGLKRKDSVGETEWCMRRVKQGTTYVIVASEDVYDVGRGSVL
ncbi:hypothetical protein NC653_038054 [Populus alba x Populus x berolinensis]|uniref:Uncharacterized protein n=1 Tax=Populus alba x Populus x berolinensis TaxID=444605 RepID=A0AAD6PSV9_9ROSI|nr:hypothetical protein NC653_038054 [Populus alba x Populus x berolinensis]